jgi:hypothetical protein
MRAIFCVVVAALAGLGARADDATDARRAVVGKWKLVGFERGGIGQDEKGTFKISGAPSSPGLK